MHSVMKILNILLLTEYKRILQTIKMPNISLNRRHKIDNVIFLKYLLSFYINAILCMIHGKVPKLYKTDKRK